MKAKMFTALAILGLIAFSGCASVRFYSDKNLTERTGLKYYTVKPFLHIERDSENRIVKATILYLPDLANPQYMVIREGVNSKKLSLKFSNGSLDTFGYTSTGKVGESVDALASMITKGTGALTDLNELKSLQSATKTSNKVELYEIIFAADKTSLREVTDSMK